MSKRSDRKAELQKARAMFVTWALERCSESQVCIISKPGHFISIHVATDLTLRRYEPSEIQEKMLQSHGTLWFWANERRSLKSLKKSEEIVESAIASALAHRNLASSLYEMHLAGSFRGKRAQLLNEAFSKGLDSEPIYVAIAGASTPKELDYFTKALAKTKPAALMSIEA